MGKWVVVLCTFGGMLFVAYALWFSNRKYERLERAYAKGVKEGVNEAKAYAVSLEEWEKMMENEDEG